MRTRCLNPNNHKYKDYGARGITIDERWMRFENFYEDMGEPPAGMQIERDDNDGPYCKSNCRWATRDEQARNKRTTVRVTLGGETRCLTEWARHFGLGWGVAKRRFELRQTPFQNATGGKQ